MTIYKPKIADRKEDKVLLNPEVVTDNLVNTKKDVPPRPPTAAIVTIGRRRRHTNVTNVCLALTAFSVFALGTIGGIYLYKHLVNPTFSGWCGVRYYEYENVEGGNQHGNSGYYHGSNLDRYGVHGQFQEHVELDRQGGKYEKIDVPEFAECKRATILHDFDRNLTAIVDKDNQHCFIMPLNRTLVRPPKDFLDLLAKLRSGYYLPDAEVVKEKYRVITPAIENLSPFGFYIWKECQRLETYRLVREDKDKPFAMSKREACEEITFSLGSSAAPYMEVVTVQMC